MFHVELTQRPNVARAFNLSDESVQSQFVTPLLSGGIFEYAGHEWEAHKARLTIVEGRALAPNELLLGRGWTNARKVGTDVTARFVDQARVQAEQRDAVARLGERILGAVAAGPITLVNAAGLADDLLAGRADQARLAVTAQAAWELLHRGRATLLDGDGARIPREEWEATLLSWAGVAGAQATTSAISLARSESDANR